MHPVANAVEVSTEKIQEYFEKAAVPDFTGQVKGYIRLLPTAAHEVEFTFDRTRTERVELGTVREKEIPHVTNARVNTVRVELMKLRIRLYCPIVSVTGNFSKGMLMSFAVQEVQ
jgi:hypothetical protein